MQVALVARDCCAWPVLTRWPDGTLGLIHFNRPSHGLVEGDLAALVSRDEGRTWTGAGLAAPRDPETNRMHIAAGVDQAGRWIALSTGFRFAGTQWAGVEPLWCSTAERPGAEWAICRNPTVAITGPFVIPHGRIAALPDGRLAATFYRAEGRDAPSHAWLAFSRDAGRTWADAVEIGDGDANEVVLLPRASGDWLAIARTQRDHHLVLWRSSDAGAHWHSPTDLTPRLQHPGDLTELGGNRILLTYGIRTRGETGIGARVSRDGGATWDEPIVLYQFGGGARDCGYPSTVRCSDGTLLTACYSDSSPLHDGYHLLTLRWSL